ncbi:MAG: hypothetical protein WC489_09145 [Patescibacteria group bacterium]
MNLRKEVPIRGAAGEGAKGNVYGQIFCEQQLMDDTITTLKGRIDGLREVLSPVMREEPDNESEDQGITAMAPVAAAICVSRARVEGIIAEIDHIYDRLELPK